MRFRNLAEIDLDRSLWKELARPLRVHANLSGAIADDLGIYCGKSLRVTIRPRLTRHKDHSAAHYTYGHISIFPCPRCEVGWLVVAYLHELIHAWLHDTNVSLYDSWDHCEFADSFADNAFLLLGGDIPSDGDCGEFRFSSKNAWRKLNQYQRFVQSLLKCDGEQIKQWVATSAARSLTIARSSPPASDFDRGV